MSQQLHYVRDNLSFFTFYLLLSLYFYSPFFFIYMHLLFILWWDTRLNQKLTFFQSLKSYPVKGFHL